MGSASSIATRTAGKRLRFLQRRCRLRRKQFRRRIRVRDMTCNFNSVCNFNGAVAVYVAEEDFVAFSSDIPAFAGVNDDGEFLSLSM